MDSPADSSFDPTVFPPELYAIALDPQETVTDPINWYDVNYDASSFTLGQQGPNTVPVGTAVTEVLTAMDQEGRPLENLPVDFLRGGPGNWKKVGKTKTLSIFGNAKFKVADKNGKKVTKYRAKVRPTAGTKGDTTNVERQR